MKTILFILVAAVLMTACNSNSQSANSGLKADTAGLAAFNAYKAGLSVKDVQRTVYVSVPVKRSSASTAARKSSPTVYKTETLSTVTENAAKAPVKKGISKAAKGAVIGGVTGGVAGAVINKRNRVAGGVIGAIAGAGVGFGVGRGMDKKDGRY